MFDIGFSEIVVIAVVALIVLGPERLPKAARFAGLWVRRARAQWYSVKSEFEREMAAEDLKRSLDEAKQTLRDVETKIRAASEDAQREVEGMRRDTVAAVQPAIEAVRQLESPDTAAQGTAASDGDGDVTATPVTGAPALDAPAAATPALGTPVLGMPDPEAPGETLPASPAPQAAPLSVDDFAGTPRP
ncbi:Sec-independent protein translocase protein TatB [Luteimonas sp. RIT-PG2_3]